jgi:hypothetical protein
LFMRGGEHAFDRVAPGPARFSSDDQVVGCRPAVVVARRAATGACSGRPDPQGRRSWYALTRVQAAVACRLYQSASYSAGGIRPQEPCRRPLFHHPTHSAVARSSSAALRHGPRRRINSALYNPLIVSASALSKLSPLEPAELAMPACSRRVV